MHTRTSLTSQHERHVTNRNGSSHTYTHARNDCSNATDRGIRLSTTASHMHTHPYIHMCTHHKHAHVNAYHDISSATDLGTRPSTTAVLRYIFGGTKDGCALWNSNPTPVLMTYQGARIRLCVYIYI